MFVGWFGFRVVFGPAYVAGAPCSGRATLTRDLDVSIAADILYEIVSIVLPYCDTRTVRELLPQLTRLNRTVDLEDEAEQK